MIELGLTFFVIAAGLVLTAGAALITTCAVMLWREQDYDKD
jgi:hypothetical protein